MYYTITNRPTLDSCTHAVVVISDERICRFTGRVVPWVPPHKNINRINRHKR